MTRKLVRISADNLIIAKRLVGHYNKIDAPEHYTLEDILTIALSAGLEDMGGAMMEDQEGD